MNQFAAHLSLEDLHRLTQESVARFEALVIDLGTNTHSREERGDIL